MCDIVLASMCELCYFRRPALLAVRHKAISGEGALRSRVCMECVAAGMEDLGGNVVEGARLARLRCHNGGV